ncbi:MAG: tetratricopeptide repeat protein [Candidatus Omnitrophica bacterium]|nr:tetratricopeptide repeat protein [Candidatus Omnitrophota bacterium]
MRRYILGFCVLLLAVCAGWSRAAHAQVNYKDEYEKIKKEKDLVSADRDNIYAQTKNLLEYKSKYRTLEAEAKKAIDEKAKLQLDSQILQEQLTGLQQKVSDLETEKEQSDKERLDLKKSLEKMMIEYKIVPETRKEITALKNENASVRRSIQQYESKMKAFEQQKLNDNAQLEIYRMQIKEHKKRYETALARNRVLEKKTEQMPTRFAEISRQNKTLLKETALMHYNLGVFYSKNKEYTRAVAEFEKSVELNPDDAASYFNLGYICAEYLVNRPKAIGYFRKFLSLVKTEDKDVDWVRKYILTWQTWEGKKPMD